MSLAEIAKRHVLASTTDAEQLARLYVPPGELGADRVDITLMDGLLSEPPQRLLLVGDGGIGKTSLLLRVLGDLARRENLPTRHEPLLLRAGDVEALESPATFVRHVLQTIELNNGRFANVDPDRLKEATADERTETGAQVAHRAGLTAPVVSYQAELKEAYEAAKFGSNSARLRSDLEDILRLVSAAGYRPVVVIDDADKFADTGPDGAIDTESIGKLFDHGVRSLCDIDQPVDVIVAAQPRFLNVEKLIQVTTRFGFVRVSVPVLPLDRVELPLGTVLKRRLERHGIDIELESVVNPIALHVLQGIYLERDHDLRSVLTLADAAAEAATREGASRLEPEHVYGIHRPGAVGA